MWQNLLSSVIANVDGSSHTIYTIRQSDLIYNNIRLKKINFNSMFIYFALFVISTNIYYFNSF